MSLLLGVVGQPNGSSGAGGGGGSEPSYPALFTGGRTGAVFALDDLSLLKQDSAGTTAVVSAGDSIGKWTSQLLARPYGITGTGTGRPLLQVDGGGRRYAHGDGLNDILQCLGNSLLAGSADGLITIAARLTAAAGVSVLFADRDGGAHISPQLYMSAGGTSWNGYWAGPGGAAGTGSTVLVGTTVVCSLLRQGSDLFQYIDGELASSSSASIGDSSATNDFSLFGFAGDYFTPADVYCLYGLSGTVTADERAQVEAWAAGLSGVTLV